jgi:lipopolysaccharide transport system permease protein
MQENPHIIIEPKKGWVAINFKEMYRYKDLLFFMVYRDVTVIYKQTVVGFAWAFINPVFSMIVFSVIFGNLAKVPSDGIPYPIFSYAALLPWTYFSQSLTNSTSSLISSANMLSKVYFPRIFIPLTSVLSKLVDFFIAFILLIIMMFYYKITPTLSILMLPVLILLMVMTAAGIGMWLSALAIQYRDVKFAVGFLEKILMYVAPVVFPASLILDNFGKTAYYVYGIYPMTGIIEGFRASLLGKTSMPWELILISAVSAMVIFIGGALYFRKMEKTFSDVA